MTNRQTERFPTSISHVSMLKVKCATLPLERRRAAFSFGREPVGGNTTIVCDAWPLQRQTHGYLPSLRWYQIYTAQDINPIAYLLDVIFAPRPGFVPGPVPLIRPASTYLA